MLKEGYAPYEIDRRMQNLANYERDMNQTRGNTVGERMADYANRTLNPNAVIGSTGATPRRLAMQRLLDENVARQYELGMRDFEDKKAEYSMASERRKMEREGFEVTRDNNRTTMENNAFNREALALARKQLKGLSNQYPSGNPSLGMGSYRVNGSPVGRSTGPTVIGN